MPIVYVKDKNGKIIHLEESFASLVWTERYQENGEFVLDLPLSKADRDVYARDNYLCMDESDFTMLIEKVEIEDDPEDQKFKVSGRTLSCVLERRLNVSKVLTICKSGYTYRGYLDEIVSQIVSDEIIDPKIERYDQYNDETTGEYKKRVEVIDAPERKISNFSYVNKAPQYLEVKASFNDIKTVYDILESLSKNNITGFKVDLTDNGGFVLETYKGKDHTTTQYTNSPLIFGPIMDNVAYMNSYDDSTNYRTIALALDKSYGDDASPGVYLWVNNPNAESGLTGIDRREVLINTSADAEENDEGNSETTSDPLEDGALEEFDTGDYDIVSISEGAIDPLVRYGIDEDYYIGDIVDMVDHFGNHYTALINEVVRSYDSNGYVITPNFQSMTEYDYGEEDSNGS